MVSSDAFTLATTPTTGKMSSSIHDVAEATISIRRRAAMTTLVWLRVCRVITCFVQRGPSAFTTMTTRSLQSLGSGRLHARNTSITCSRFSASCSTTSSTPSDTGSVSFANTSSVHSTHAHLDDPLAWFGSVIVADVLASTALVVNILIVFVGYIAPAVCSLSFFLRSDCVVSAAVGACGHSPAQACTPSRHLH